MERRDLGDISQILLVVEIVQIFPLSTACVERGFSLLKILKTDYKTHRDEETLNALMRINTWHKANLDRDQYDPTRAVRRWWLNGVKGRRPNLNN